MSEFVDRVARELLAPLLSAQPGPTQWRLVSWDAEYGISLFFARGERTLLVEFEDRDESESCFARTARFNVCARRPFAGGEALDEEERRVVSRVVELVVAREGSVPQPAEWSTSRPSLVREIHVDRVLMREGGRHYYVNPYVGCMIGCEFCWVAPRAELSRRIEGVPVLPWGRWVDVKTNAAAVLAREVRDAIPGVVRMSPVVTDPYQPLEKKFRITRSCLEVLGRGGFVPVILTRESRVLEDLELLRTFRAAAVGFSIPSNDDAMRLAFEPGASPIDERFAALEACRAAGLRTFVVIQPMLPMDTAEMVRRVAPFADAVRIDRLHAADKYRHLYERAGRPDALDPAFFERTAKELRAGFASHGIRTDDLDDLATALGLWRALDTK